MKIDQQVRYQRLKLSVRPTKTTNRLWQVFTLIALFAVLSSACTDTKNPDSTASKDGTSSGDGAAVLEEASSGEIASDWMTPPVAKALGSIESPIDWDSVAAQSLVGDAVVLKKTTRNPCFALHLETIEFKNSAPTGMATVYIQDGPGGPPKLVTIICSEPAANAIWPWTSGPGSNGISIACPPLMPRVIRGTGQVSARPMDLHDLSQAEGSYGWNKDGLWNFKFFNWGSRNVSPTIFAVCE